MKRINHILAFSLLSLTLPLSSCSQDDSTENGLNADGDEISFVAYLPDVSTRTYDLKQQLLSNGFTVSAISPEGADADGFLDTLFENTIVRRKADGAFRSDRCRWADNRDDNVGHLKFFAFHPSCDDMKQRAGVGNECFVYSNSSVKDASGINYDYRLTKFRVAPDISKQVDFISAIGEGNKTKHLYCGIELVFEHQLCGVEIGVWGASTLYDVEIAGVRIGGTVVEADFNLATEIEKPVGKDNTIGSWLLGSPLSLGHVDYVFTTGDKVVVINDKEHNTKDKAASIMGTNGGKAMVIPHKRGKWDYPQDRFNDNKGTYFSALIRMTQRGGDVHRIIYPSTDPDSRDHIVYLSVRKSDGTVMERLDKNGNIFGTATKYDIPSTEELRHYGWAAAPADVDWKAGYTYRYILDYSRGVGIHDPADNNPASPIIDWGGVEITTYNGLWGDGDIIKNADWGANTNNTAEDGTIWWK